MILLKYAKLLPESYKGPVQGLKLDKRDLNTLTIRTKEFVICGFQISAEQAVALSETERAVYYEARDQFLRELVCFNGLASRDDEEATKMIMKAKWKTPQTEAENINDFLALAGLNNG